MRILAIRGRNLASLAGDFEMRLDAPPLAGAGLFAITGRTGAGKSSILDALCLALFDRMPRLPAGRGAEVGRADDAPQMRLRNNDVRSILRRGAGEGYAEVDFRGVDRRRYRARWSVRRARQRAGGRFQAQTMALEDLDSGENLSAAKTEVLEAIQVRLGLTFDQFRRSVLLAQGDFAAFLRADAGERAELLERITGTGIYGEISKAAHRRAAEAHKRLDLIRQRLGDQRPLDDESRGALEAELAEARRALDEQHKAQQLLQQAQRWYQTLDKLTGERDQCAERLTKARADQDAAAPRQRELERILVLQPLRLPLIAFDQATQVLSKTRQDLEQTVAELHERQQAAEQVATAAATSEADYLAAHKAMEDANPALQEARRLDTRVQEVREQVRRAEAECSSARQALQDVRKEQDELQRRAAQATEALQQAENWLADQAGIEPLAAQWEAWVRELDRCVQARRALDEAKTDIEAAERRGADLADRRGALETLIAQIATERSRAMVERSDLEQQAAAFDLERLAVLREERLARRDRVAEWQRLAQQARENRDHLDATGAKLASEQGRQAESQERLGKIEADMAPLAAGLAEAEDAHGRLLLASAGEVKDLRAGLQDGRPCPVCGAEQHPWAHGAGTRIADLADEQAARVRALKRRSEQKTTEKARELAESSQAARRVAELTSELEHQQSLLDLALTAWSACEIDSLRPADPFADRLDVRHREELQALGQSLKQIAGDEVKARALIEQIKVKTTGIESLNKRLDAEKTRLSALGEQIRVGTEARNRAELERSRAEETLGQLLDLLAEPLKGIQDWRAGLQADPEAFIGTCRNLVAAWRLRVKQRDEANQSRQDLMPSLAEAQARRQGAKEDLVRRTAALDQQSTGLEGLEKERGAVLDGRPVDTVESELSAAVTRTLRQQEQSRSDLARAREALTKAQGAAATRRQALQEREAAAARSREHLDRQMVAQGISLDELREAMKRDHGWIEGERLALQALRDACDRARELLKERDRRLQEHQAAEPPRLTPEAVSERLTAASGSVKSAQDRWGRLHGRLEEDERRRAAGREIQTELEGQQASWELWESLRELIGSADGAKFRNFAQGLTLDLLVAHANIHLRDLARRYELQRVPGAEMEIQVIDREMGDEVRSIHSLSGGEGFLASLALALGLASLASDRVEIESLFIDEGFGALDSDSLDLAIAGLDALYSLGRQVGVISHVGALVERIGVRVQVTKQGGGRSRLGILCD